MARVNDVRVVIRTKRDGCVRPVECLVSVHGMVRVFEDGRWTTNHTLTQAAMDRARAAANRPMTARQEVDRHLTIVLAVLPTASDELDWTRIADRLKRASQLARAVATGRRAG